jgi:acetylornithine deacetylase/succinyl-diaminopimelate desuccinylase-like protein
MKSGLLAGLYAIKALVGELGGVPFERLTFIANPDEEIGSASSTPHIRAAAEHVDACFVLECARANGDFVSRERGSPTSASHQGGRPPVSSREGRRDRPVRAVRGIHA